MKLAIHTLENENEKDSSNLMMQGLTIQWACNECYETLENESKIMEHNMTNVIIGSVLTAFFRRKTTNVGSPQERKTWYLRNSPWNQWKY